jgi:outer membrane protein assembly factor BamB
MPGDSGRDSVRAVPASLAAVLVALLALAPTALAADAWPMQGHDAARTNRSAVVSAQGPGLVPGWPRAGLAGPVLVAPGGAVVLAAETTAVLNRDGTRRRTLPIGPLRAIGPDGRLYVWAAPTAPVAAYGPAGELIWRSPPYLGVGPEASNAELRPAADGSVYLAGDDGVVALDPTGRVRWRLPMSLEDDPGAVAVGPDRTAFIARTDGASPTLVALHPDGRTLWQRPLDGSAGRVAVADDGTVIVLGGGAGLLGARALTAFAPDGSRRWSVPAARDATGMAIGRDGTAYLVEARSGALRAIGPDGAVRWTHRGRLASRDPIVGGDGTIYAGGSPLVALRPDGSRAWSFPPTGRPLVPDAIGADGTLFATAGPNLAGSAVLALAGPSARRRVAPPSPARQRALVAGLRLAPSRLRMTGAESVCPAPGRACRPSTALGATLAFTLKRDAAVLVVIRRRGGRIVTRRAWHTGAGTTWTGLSDAADYRVLGPGRYALTVRAAAGAARATAGPLPFTVVRS